MSDSLLSQGDGQQQDGAADEAKRDFVVAEDSAPPRPEWLPEKYKSPEDLAKAYKELESKIGMKEEDLRAKLAKEFEEQAYADRPESKGDYQLPEYIDNEAAVDNELLSWWADHAFENGFSQSEFEQGIEMYMKANQASMPDLEAEQKKLGDNASARIQSASVFATKFFPQEALPAIERMCETHEGILALEAIMEATKDGGFSGSSNAVNQMTEDSLRQMMNDERYWNPARRDPAFIKQVDQGFAKLYGR